MEFFYMSGNNGILISIMDLSQTTKIKPYE